MWRTRIPASREALALSMIRSWNHSGGFRAGGLAGTLPMMSCRPGSSMCAVVTRGAFLTRTGFWGVIVDKFKKGATREYD